MSALRQSFRHRSRGAWHVLVCLTLLALLCRAMIPMGYMPDFSGARDGGFTITLCTVGGGTSTLSVHPDGPAQSSLPDGHVDSQDCPFGILISQAVAPGHETPALISNITHRPLPLPHRNQAQPPLPALGPPLGSRAPPVNLG